MTDLEGTVLRGPPGDNPLGFLAALGVQVAMEDQGLDCWLHWTDDPIPRPVVTPARDLEEFASSALVVAAAWLNGPALHEAIEPKLKLRPPHIREYLRRGLDAGSPGALAFCLLAEDSLDNRGNAKPSDLYFTAGQQKFVSMARTILAEVTVGELVEDIASPWRYRSSRDSLMWDSTDDRLHAHSAADPTSSQNPKLTNPGAEALAVIGLSRYPCFASPQGTLTQGCSGDWKRGTFVWPLWTVPSSVRTVGSLLAQVAAPQGSTGHKSDSEHRAEAYRSWGLSRVMQSQIRRSPQGSYGTFGPPRIMWQRE